MTNYKRLAAILVPLLAFASSAFAQSSIPAATYRAPATIAAGDTFQLILATPALLLPNRRAITIQNNNTTTTDNCWIFFGAGTPTKSASILLLPGAAPYMRSFPFVPSDNIYGTCVTTGNTIYVDYN